MVHFLLITFIWLQSVDSTPPSWLTYYFLPIVGCSMFVFCILAGTLLQHIQKFNGFGIHLEVTTQVFLSIISFVMMAAGFGLHFFDASKRLQDLTEKERTAEQRAEAAEHFTLRLVLAYPKQQVDRELVPNTTKPGDQATNLICRYKLASSDNTEETRVLVGHEGTVVIVIHDLARKDVIQDLAIGPAHPGRASVKVLAKHALYPLEPKYNLDMEDFSFGSH
jgi:hypothetical protein